VFLHCTKETIELTAADFGAFASSPLEANVCDAFRWIWFDRKYLDAYAELNHGAAFVTQPHLKPTFDLLSGVAISRDMLSNVVCQYRGSSRRLQTHELEFYDVKVSDFGL
jgi:hypothetical protein